jgi:hypothetical protein
MPEQTRDSTAPAPPAPPARPVPDLGFFAGAPAPSAGAFGAPGATSSFGTPAAAPFGTPQAAPFGAPTSSQFGQPGPAPFGSPAGPFASGPAPVGSTSVPRPGSGAGPGWKLAAAGGAVIVLVALVLVGRFGWQQFLADPVAPDTLMGMPKVGGADTDAMAAQLADGFGEELGSGSKTAIAMYSDGLGSGYVLAALRGGSGSSSSGNDSGTSSAPGDEEEPFAGWAKTTMDGVDCYSQPAQAAGGMGTTVCMRDLWRRAVVVFGVASVPPDPATVARATNEAWDAQ